MHAIRTFAFIVLLLCAAGLLGVPTAVRSEHPDPSLRQALDYLAAADTLAAIDALSAADLEAVADPQCFILLGRLHRETGTIESRLKSQYVLERAVQLYPDDADVALEMGLTYFSQTFYPDAARHFIRALDLNPNLCIAKYKLGITHYERWKLRVNAFADEVEKASTWLERALACDPDNVDAAIRYVNSLYGRGEPAEAEAAARRFAGRFPRVPDFPLMAGTVARDDGRVAVADSAYRAAIAVMNDEEKEAYLSLGENVLGYDDLDAYEKAPESRRETMGRAFWVHQDIDPTTDLNERLVEHFYRTHRADLFFSHAKFAVVWTKPQIRGWDTERGEVTIKLGWPDSIYATHGGDRFEEWKYEYDDAEVWYPFVDRFLNGNLQVPPSRSEKLAAIRFSNRIASVRSDAAEVEGVIDAVAFKNDNMSCSIYVTAQLNADSIRYHADAATIDHYTVRTRFFDEAWQAEVTDTATLRPFEVPTVPGSEGPLLDVVRSHKMPFGVYSVAFAFEDDAVSAAARLRSTCDASHLASSNLVSSEILFLRDVENDGGAVIARGDRSLPPNPWRAYAHGQRVRAYVELYNLAVDRGRSRYRVTYAIHEDPGDEPSPWRRLGGAIGRFVGLAEGNPSVAQTFERVGTAHRAEEMMAIDIDMLPEGRYRLWLTVDDLNGGDTWETSRSFTKVGERVASGR